MPLGAAAAKLLFCPLLGAAAAEAEAAAAEAVAEEAAAAAAAAEAEAAAAAAAGGARLGLRGRAGGHGGQHVPGRRLCLL